MKLWFVGLVFLLVWNFFFKLAYLNLVIKKVELEKYMNFETYIPLE